MCFRDGAFCQQNKFTQVINGIFQWPIMVTLTCCEGQDSWPRWIYLTLAWDETLSINSPWLDLQLHRLLPKDHIPYSDRSISKPGRLTAHGNSRSSLCPRQWNRTAFFSVENWWHLGETPPAKLPNHTESFDMSPCQLDHGTKLFLEHLQGWWHLHLGSPFPCLTLSVESFLSYFRPRLQW